MSAKTPPPPPPPPPSTTMFAKDTPIAYLQDLQLNNPKSFNDDVNWHNAPEEMLITLFPHLPNCGKSHPPKYYPINNTIGVLSWRSLDQDTQNLFINNSNEMDSGDIALQTRGESLDQIKSLKTQFQENVSNELQELCDQLMKLMDGDDVDGDDVEKKKKQLNDQIEEAKKLVTKISTPYNQSYLTGKALSHLAIYNASDTTQPLEYSAMSKGGVLKDLHDVTTEPYFEKMKYYHLCNAISGRQGSNKTKWDLIDTLAGIDPDHINERTDYKKGGLYHWWLKKKDGVWINQVHPFERPYAEGKTLEDVYSVYELIDVLRKFQLYVAKEFSYYPPNKICLGSGFQDQEGKISHVK